MTIYRGLFNDQPYYKGCPLLENLLHHFGISHTTLLDVEILWAEYDKDGYSGKAWVLFRKDGQLYEVNASHCSCYGLEDQWKPQKTSVKSLSMREKVNEETELVDILLAFDN